MGVTGLFFPGTGTYVCLISSMAFFLLENSKVNLSEHFSESTYLISLENLFLPQNIMTYFCPKI